mmetsp:Transcript_18893/g.54719  ORF Transcript_18893/g.54719 Transcript_18893/m.54719 type:complete len:231 (+) Transcript_18893:1525-2217(+)
MGAGGHERDEARYDQQGEDGGVVAPDASPLHDFLGGERRDGQGQYEHDGHVSAERDDVGRAHDAQYGHAGVGAECRPESRPLRHHDHQIQEESRTGSSHEQWSPEVSPDDSGTDGQADGEDLGEGDHAHALVGEAGGDGPFVLGVDHAIAVSRQHCRGFVALTEDGEGGASIVDDGLELSLPPEQVVGQIHANESGETSGNGAYNRRPRRLVSNGEARDGLETIPAFLEG